MENSRRAIDRNAGVVLPFCHITLRAKRTLPQAYPGEPKTLGEHLRKRIMDLGLSTESCASKFGVHPTTINSWQTGRQNPAAKHMPRVIDFLGYSPFDTNTYNLAERIVMLRKTCGLTGKNLARSLGVNVETVSRWETGQAVPSRRHQAELESLFASQGAITTNTSDCAA